MKKVLALLLAAVMLMAVAAAETVNTKETIKVGVVQLVDMVDSDNAYEGMLATVAYCDSMGYAYDVVGYTDVPDSVTQANALDPDEYAYVYVALDSVIAANFNQLGETLTEMGIPVYGVADAMTKGGALCSYGVDYTIVGNMTGEMIVEWYNGTPLESMPCRRYSEFSLVINSDVQAALGIELPEDYAAQATYVTTVRAN